MITFVQFFFFFFLPLESDISASTWIKSWPLKCIIYFSYCMVDILINDAAIVSWLPGLKFMSK